MNLSPCARSSHARLPKAHTALGVSVFEQPGISARTDPIYIFVMIRLPQVLVIVAGLAAMTNVVLLLRHRTAGGLPVS